MILSPYAPAPPLVEDFDPGLSHPKQDFHVDLVEPPIPCPALHNPPSAPPTGVDRPLFPSNPWKTASFRSTSAN